MISGFYRGVWSACFTGIFWALGLQEWICRIDVEFLHGHVGAFAGMLPESFCRISPSNITTTRLSRFRSYFQSSKVRRRHLYL